MRNLRLVIAYDGTDFRGWQRQPGLPTVQSCLESAIQSVVGEAVKVVGSGRTDAGVHALNQVANFNINSPIPCENLLKALNRLLPPTVRVKDVCEAAATFNARYAVRSKTYRYRILQAPICSPFMWRFVCHYPYPLDRSRMAEAARLLEGEHDFSSFAGSDGSLAGEDLHDPSEGGQHCQGARVLYGASGGEAEHHGSKPSAPDMVRTIFASHLLWCPRPSILIYEVRGNGFLRYMVRNLVGTLMEVGRGRLEPDAMIQILAARDRKKAGPTALAQGLCLWKVEYY